MSTGYQVTIKIANSVVDGRGIPHAFVTIAGSGLNKPLTVGYYPQVRAVSGPGTVRNDGYYDGNVKGGTESVIPHPYDRSITFDASAQQVMNGLQFVARVANDPGMYQLLGAPDKSNLVFADGYQCTGFARDVLRAMGIQGLDLYPRLGMGGIASLASSYPGMLGPEFSFLSPNQVQPFRGTPTQDDFDSVLRQIYSGIKKFDPSDRTPAADVPALNGASSLDSAVQEPVGLGQSRNSNVYILNGPDVHSAIIAQGGTLSDLWVWQRLQANGFADAQAFYAAVLASNPQLTDVNRIPVGTTIYLPERMRDGSITLHYAGGVSINHHPVTGEYHMVVPDGSGGTIVYSRVANDVAYTVREVHTDATGAVTLDFTGTQSGLEASITATRIMWTHDHDVGQIQVFENGSSIETVEDGDSGSVTETVYDSEQQVLAQTTYADPQARRDAAQLNAMEAGVALFDAIRHHNNLGAVAALTRLVNEARVAADQPLAFSPQLGAVVGLLGALDSFSEAHNDAQKFVATARLMLSANQTYAAFNDGQGFLDASTGLTPLNAASAVLALSNLDGVLKSGNPFAIASTFMSITNSAVSLGLLQSSAAFGPQAMIAVAIASILFGDLFGGEIEYPDPPPAGLAEIGLLADGTLGMLFKDADGQVYQSRKLTGQVLVDAGKSTDQQDWALGAQVLSDRMIELIALLETEAARSGLRLVLERLPSLSVHGYPSFAGNGVNNFFFAIGFNDPVSGARQMVASALQDLMNQFKAVAGHAEALVDPLEWAHIQLKRAANDPFASETEGQYLDRLSGPVEGDSLLSRAQADEQEHLNRQTYSVLTLDMNGNGITLRPQSAAGLDLESVSADVRNGIARLDVDNDGFLELTEWVGGQDAILGLDRDGDGRLGSAHELLSGAELGDTAERLGLQRLSFFDANKDARLSALDPLFAKFKLWLDLNGDARCGVGEVNDLSKLGVTHIDLRTGAVVFADGQALTLELQQLSADVRGVAVRAETDAMGDIQSGAYTVHLEGYDPQYNLTSDAAKDLSEILRLVRPDEAMGDDERIRLSNLASRYGVDLSNPAGLLGLGGGGNRLQLTPEVAHASDVFTINQAPDAAEVRAALRAFFSEIWLDPDAGPDVAHHVLQAQEDVVFRIRSVDLLAGLTGVTLLSVQDARRGTVRMEASGDVMFEPNAQHSGSAYFTYTARNQEGQTRTAMVWLNVASMNDAPVAQADAFSVGEDQALTLSASQLLANDVDVDMAGDPNEHLSVTAVGLASRGTVRLQNGRITFQPDADLQGEAQFAYTVTDAAGASATALATITVVGVNDAPVAAGLSSKIAARPDRLLRIETDSWQAHVRDADLPYGDALRIQQVVSVSAGQAWLQQDGSVLFKAAAMGDVRLQLQVVDRQGSAVLVPITVAVSTENAAAAAILPGTDQASEDTSVRLASTQTITAVLSATNGTAVLDAQGALTFVPTPHYNGPAQVQYQIRHADGSIRQKTADFQIAAVNDAPVVVQPLPQQTMDEDGALTLGSADLLATVSDVDIATNGQTLRLSQVGQAVNGSVSLDANGQVVFRPLQHFNGQARFSYWVSDDQGASVEALAQVTVRAVNDAPIALAHRMSSQEDEARTLTAQSLIANAELVDPDVRTNADVLRVSAVSLHPASASKGMVALNPAGHVVFTPQANMNGQVVLLYTLTDLAGASSTNSVTLDVLAVNDAPQALAHSLVTSKGTEDVDKWLPFADLLRHFSDVDGDALTVRSVGQAVGGQVRIQGGQVVFTPNRDFNMGQHGWASFNVVVADPSGATASATAQIAFSNVNDAPMAAPKQVQGRAFEDNILRVGFAELLSGAHDPDGDAVQLKSVRALANSSASIDWSNRQVVFSGNRNFNGWSGFEYTLSDPYGASGTQTVSIQVQAVNDHPTVRGLTGFQVWEDGHDARHNQDPAQSVAIRLNRFLTAVGAADVDGDALSFGEFWGTQRISQIWQDGQDVMLRLERNFNGVASFQYRVRDGQGGWADGKVQLNVMAQNDRPWMEGLPGWPSGSSSNMGGDFSARIYGFDVDSPTSALSSWIDKRPWIGDATVALHREWWSDEWTSYVFTVLGQWDLQYQSTYGNSSSDLVSFGVGIADRDGGSQVQTVATRHVGSVASRGGKPVAIDLNGDGIHYTNLDEARVLFDINGDGVRDLLSWTAADDGLIVFDKDGDGCIEALDEVSFLSYLLGARTDLEGLKGFDSDGDGHLTARDDRWSRFGVWQDINQDGVCDPGEFKSLDAWGICRLDLSSNEMMDQVGDVYILGKSTFFRNDGSTGELADVAFRYIDAADPSGMTQKKTFNIDIQGLLKQRLRAAQQEGASDEQIQAMLQRFVSDLALVGRTAAPEPEPIDAQPWSDSQYAELAVDAQQQDKSLLNPA